MAEPEHFQVLILGSGQGGKLLAWDLARSGKEAGVVERQWVGGSCPAVACLPSKNEIWSARVAHLAQHAGQFGTVTGPVHTDMATVRRRKQGMIDRDIAFHLSAYKESGAELDSKHHGNRAPLARIGLSENEAQNNGVAVRFAKLPMSKVLRTMATDETQGFMKAVVGVNDDRILGFTRGRSRGSDGYGSSCDVGRLPYPKLRDAVIAHLTVAEGLGPLLSNVPEAP